MRNIEWKANEHTNKSSRKGWKPCAIVDHIAEGSIGSVDNWFTDPDNNISSAHFCVGKNGEIHQYVKIEEYAWANGLQDKAWEKAPAQIVKDKAANPNYYTVSIEHDGTDGDLTDEQFYATCWLHRYIKDYVESRYGIQMPLTRYSVIGHHQIDPIRKPCCPGDKFPWERLYKELELADRMTLAEYEMRLDYMRSPAEINKHMYGVRARIEDLYQKAIADGEYKGYAVQKMLRVKKFLQDEQLLDPND